MAEKSENVEKSRSNLRSFLIAAVVAGLLLAVVSFFRRYLGVDLDPFSLRQFMQSFGPIGPLVFIGLTAGRMLIGIPSQLILVVGGLCFGTGLGTLYGGLGLVSSGLVTFLAARWAGREAVEARVPEKLQPVFEKAGSRLGALFIFIGTAYPIGFITAYNAMAGVTALSFARFAVALTGGSLVRAFLYARFGDTLVGGDLTTLIASSAIIAAAAFVPLLFPAPRRWIADLLMR